MSLIGDGLDKAVHKAFTRPASRTAGPQMRYLVKQLGGTKAVARLLRISRRTVERYVKEQIQKPRPDLAACLEREVKKRWQPQVRAKVKARAKAVSTGGVVIDTRARMGCTAPVGSTDQDRIRHLAVTLPPVCAARLLDALEQGAGDVRLQEIAAEALKEVYFVDTKADLLSFRGAGWHVRDGRPTATGACRHRCPGDHPFHEVFATR